MAQIAFVANTNILLLTGLKNETDETFVNDAVVTVTIVDSAGEPVAGTSWPLTMLYVADSDGNYSVALTHTMPFVNKKKYTANIDANGGSNPELWGHWEMPITGETRTGAEATD